MKTMKQLKTIIKQKKEINTLKLRIAELEETLNSKALERVITAIDTIESVDKLKEQNKRLRKQIKELKEERK